MPTRVDIPPEALRDIKALRKKYRAITSEIQSLVEQLEADDRPGNDQEADEP